MKRSPFVTLLLVAATLFTFACGNSPTPKVGKHSLTPAPGWVGMNYNWTHSFEEARSDLTTIKSWGITRVRLNIVDWNGTEQIAHWRAIAVEALNQGFYVLYGFSQGPDNSPATEPGYTAALQAEAVWAQGIGNPKLELVIGNEAELHPHDETKAPRDLIRRLAAAIKPIYTVGKISYSTSAYYWAMSGWAGDPESLGSLDRLGLNVFYSSSDQFKAAVTLLLSKFPSQFYVSEWNADGGFQYRGGEMIPDSKIAVCLKILKELKVGEAYFYTFLDLNQREGTYGLKTGDGVFHHPAVEYLKRPDTA